MGPCHCLIEFYFLNTTIFHGEKERVVEVRHRVTERERERETTEEYEERMHVTECVCVCVCV